METNNWEFRELEKAEALGIFSNTGADRDTGTSSIRADIFQHPLFEISYEAKFKNHLRNKRYGLFSADGKLQIYLSGYVLRSKLGDIFVSQHGPVFSGSNASAQSWGEFDLEFDVKSGSANFYDALNYFLEQLLKDCQRGSIMAVILEPLTINGGGIHRQLLKTGFKALERSNLPIHPIYIDLNHSEDEMIANLEKKTRYNINYARRKGLATQSFFPANDEAPIEEFYRFMQQAADHKDFGIPSYQYFQKIWEEFKDTRNIAIIKTSLAGETMSINFSQFYGSWGGTYYTANSPKGNRFKASYLLKWDSIVQAKALGASLFDMWGHIPGADESHPEYGYSRFKLGFNPIQKEFPGRLLLPISPVRTALWSSIQRLDSMLNWSKI